MKPNTAPKDLQLNPPPSESHRPKSPRDDGGYYLWMSKRAIERVLAAKDIRDKYKAILALTALTKIASDEDSSRFSCSQEHIGQQVGRTDKTIRPGLHALAALGIIHIERVIKDGKRKESIYTLLSAKSYRKPRVKATAGTNGKVRHLKTTEHNKETSLPFRKRDVSKCKETGRGIDGVAAAASLAVPAGSTAATSEGMEFKYNSTVNWKGGF
jgi:hypothetical protein